MLPPANDAQGGGAAGAQPEPCPGGHREKRLIEGRAGCLHTGGSAAGLNGGCVRSPGPPARDRPGGCAAAGGLPNPPGEGWGTAPRPGTHPVLMRSHHWVPRDPVTWLVASPASNCFHKLVASAMSHSVLPMGTPLWWGSVSPSAGRDSPGAALVLEHPQSHSTAPHGTQQPHNTWQPHDTPQFPIMASDVAQGHAGPNSSRRF